MCPFQIFDLTIYACIFRHFLEFIYASLPSTNDCQKSVCHFTDAKIQYAFLHKMPFYTTANLHYCLFTLLPIYRRAHLSIQSCASSHYQCRNMIRIVIRKRSILRMHPPSLASAMIARAKICIMRSKSSEPRPFSLCLFKVIDIRLVNTRKYWLLSTS